MLTVKLFQRKIPPVCCRLFIQMTMPLDGFLFKEKYPLSVRLSEISGKMPTYAFYPTQHKGSIWLSFLTKPPYKAI